MRNYCLIAAIFFMAALVCGAQEPDSGIPAKESIPEAAAGETVPPTLDQIMARPFSANLKKVEVGELLRSLARIGPLNIVATKLVAGQLTFLLENVTIGDALEIVLITNGLAKEIKGNIIHIMTEAEYQALYGKPYNTRLAVKTYQMQFVLPSRVANFLDNIKSRNVSSQIIPDNGTRTLVIIEVQDKIREMEEMIRHLDVPPETLTFELKNASVDDIMPLVTALLTPNYGDVKMDKRTKRFIVTDHESVLEHVARLIYDFDGKPRQVLIEAKVIQISLTDDFNMGVNWEQVFSSFSKLKDFKFAGNFPVIADKAKTINLTSTVGTFPQGNYKYVIQALQDFGDNKLISAPRLMTMSDKRSEFHIGSTVRYPKTTQTTATGGAATLSETFEEIKEGVTLNITAAINTDRYITMEILPKITKVVKWEQTGLGNPFPAVIEEGTTTTNVMVKDGVTIVIAGLIKDEKQVSHVGMPIVSQIPLLGKLLSSKRDYVVKSETVIFMTPYIISGDADSSVISRQYDFERKEPKELKPIK